MKGGRSRALARACRRSASALAVLCGLHGAAAAQDGSIPMAEAAFRQAKGLMDQGNYAEACPKFAESYRQDPQPGTMLNLALCHEKQGKTASAWGEYAAVLSLAQRQGQAERAAYADARVKELEPKLSVVAFRVAAPAPGETLKLDGNEVGRSVWTGVPVDPGEHVVEATGPGVTAWRSRIVVPNGPNKLDVDVPALTPQPAGSDASVPAPPPRGSGTRTAGIVVGVGGLVVLAGAVGLGALAKSQYDDAVTGCERRDDATHCAVNSGAGQEAESARGLATVGTVVGAVGVAAVAAGVVLYLLPSGRARAASGLTPRAVTAVVLPSRSGAALSLEARF